MYPFADTPVCCGGSTQSAIIIGTFQQRGYSVGLSFPCCLCAHFVGNLRSSRLGRDASHPRVLGEMAGLGFTATELGAPGFLPTSPEGVKEELGAFGMSLLGGFTPVVLHDKSQREATLESARATAKLFEAAGATKFISSVVQDMDWSHPRALDSDEQRHMAEMFGIIDDICAEHGLEQVLHPHVQTLVETKDDISRVLDSCDVHFCLDTGHMAFGGQDPVQFAKDAMDRVGHVHLKDIRLDMVEPVLRREVSLMAATQAGIFTPWGKETWTSWVLSKLLRVLGMTVGM